MTLAPNGAPRAGHVGTALAASLAAAALSLLFIYVVFADWD